jgi:hypothetical protein
VASLDHVYLLGTGSWVSEFSGPVRVLMRAPSSKGETGGDRGAP